MVRSYSIWIPIGILVLAWSASSTPTAPNLEDQFQQLRKEFIQFKEVMNEKEATFEAVLTELKAKDQQNSKIRELLANKINELEEKIAGLEAKTHEKIQQPGASPNGVNELKHQSRSINGMPSSCGDLQMIGHTWNGLYTVMGLRTVSTVYCDFTKSLDDPGFETRIGYTDTKSMPVYFYVQRETRYFNGGPMPFEIEQLNTGGFMDIASGKFTAPRPGIYFFSYTGIAAFPASTTPKSYLVVGLYLNGVGVGVSEANVSNNAEDEYEQLSLQATLHMNAGDQVWLGLMYASAGSYLHDDIRHFTHFNGWLLEEDISQAV
ncbi:hypothetical protein GHT06_011031 [Daphnia sinensis]|uniref:C1q domain-containing protein n=1 Tax=Daphnia sinensis TaxID=1820382 RepID=A0AAD5PXZ3_9CRUS|nr:hypothetical protein GHT06_011031 [Daphnia sinensis]